jgi:hypothetical protein
MTGLPNFIKSDQRMVGGSFDAQRLVERLVGFIQASLGAELDSACWTRNVEGRPGKKM